MKELKIDALNENLPEVISFVDEQLEAADCPMKLQIKLDIAVEEIFVNIANYAYPDGTGTAFIRVEILADPPTAEITFIDSGIPYDPLAKPDPDVHLSANERQIGGLGIYMVKKSMDEMEYQYIDGQNILMLRKRLVIV